MGFRRRTRRRAVIAGAAVAHHENKKYEEQQQAQSDDGDQGVDDQVQQDQPDQDQPQQEYAPPPADPADEIEHLAELHASGALIGRRVRSGKGKGAWHMSKIRPTRH